VKNDNTIPNNKMDIIIRGNEKGIYKLIDTAFLGDGHNICSRQKPKRFYIVKNKITIQQCGIKK
jgi:hypothetical protein